MQEQEAAEIIWQKRAEIIHSSTSKMMLVYSRARGWFCSNKFCRHAKQTECFVACLCLHGHVAHHGRQRSYGLDLRIP